MRHTILRLTIAFAALLTAVYAFASEYPIGNTAYPSGWIVTPGSQGFDIAEGAMWFGSDMVLYGGLGRTCTLDTSTWQSTWHAAPIQERWISGVAVGTGCWFGSQEGTIMSRHPSGGWTHIARHNSDAVVELIKLHNEVVSVWRSGRVETIDIYDTDRRTTWADLGDTLVSAVFNGPTLYVLSNHGVIHRRDSSGTWSRHVISVDDLETRSIGVDSSGSILVGSEGARVQWVDMGSMSVTQTDYLFESYDGTLEEGMIRPDAISQIVVLPNGDRVCASNGYRFRSENRHYEATFRYDAVMQRWSRQPFREWVTDWCSIPTNICVGILPTQTTDVLAICSAIFNSCGITSIHRSEYGKEQSVAVSLMNPMGFVVMDSDTLVGFSASNVLAGTLERSGQVIALREHRERQGFNRDSLYGTDLVYLSIEDGEVNEEIVPVDVPLTTLKSVGDKLIGSTRQHLYVSENGGHSFERLKTQPDWLGTILSVMGADNAVAMHAIVSDTTIRGSWASGRLFRSLDRGETWGLLPLQADEGVNINVVSYDLSSTGDVLVLIQLHDVSTNERTMKIYRWSRDGMVVATPDFPEELSPATTTYPPSIVSTDSEVLIAYAIKDPLYAYGVSRIGRLVNGTWQTYFPTWKGFDGTTWVVGGRFRWLEQSGSTVLLRWEFFNGYSSDSARTITLFEPRTSLPLTPYGAIVGGSFTILHGQNNSLMVLDRSPTVQVYDDEWFTRVGSQAIQLLQGTEWRVNEASVGGTLFVSTVDGRTLLQQKLTTQNEAVDLTSTMGSERYVFLQIIRDGVIIDRYLMTRH